MEGLSSQLEYILPLAQNLLVTWGFKLLGGLAVIVVGRFIAGSLRKTANRFMERTETDPTLANFLSSLVYYLILVAAAVAALGMIGIQMASVLTILATAGLAVGLALQGTLSNVAAGVMLLIFRPFKVGDLVEVAGGPRGKIESIGLFSTNMNTPDNIHIVVPNSAIYGGTIKNYSHHPIRRVDLVMGISYDDDIGVAVNTIKQVLDAETRVLQEPAYQVAVSELADSSVNLVVRPWCKGEEYWNVLFDLTRNLKEQLEAAGCSIPYPQRDVHMHTVD
ncbi:MAG: mechanosensitive ion channel [Gemmatimonadetes bacterium]|nr:mechanosensitive ion channel [Gemmatimonadota bacterium]NNM06629.1 mechanosensitive ion channel [Gemmatimonadota bacterium]